MLEFVVVCYRRPNWSREEFRRYFQDVHGPLALALPGLRRYVQNLVQPDVRRDPPWDAVVEMWFEDRQAVETARASDAGRRASQRELRGPRTHRLERRRRGRCPRLIAGDGCPAGARA